MEVGCKADFIFWVNRFLVHPQLMHNAGEAVTRIAADKSLYLQDWVA